MRAMIMIASLGLVSGCGSAARTQPTEPARVLPSGEIELPPATTEDLRVPEGFTTRKTRGLAVVHQCRAPGSDAAPSAALLQSSGDPAFDQALFAERVVRHADEAPGPLRCTFKTAIKLPRLAHEPVEPIVITPGQLEAVSGDRGIFPSDRVKRQILNSGKQRLMIPIKLCIDHAGRVDRLDLLSSSGFLAYDLDLMNGVAAWRFEPYLVDGKPVPVCTVFQFLYNQMDGTEGGPWRFPLR